MEGYTCRPMMNSLSIYPMIYCTIGLSNPGVIIEFTPGSNSIISLLVRNKYHTWTCTILWNMICSSLGVLLVNLNGMSIINDS